MATLQPLPANPTQVTHSTTLYLDSFATLPRQGASYASMSYIQRIQTWPIHLRQDLVYNHRYSHLRTLRRAKRNSIIYRALNTPKCLFTGTKGPPPMTKADLVDHVTALGDLTRRDGEIIVDTLFESVIGALQSGDKIEIRGFGSFRTRPPAQRPHRPQPQNRRKGRRPRKARPLLQA